MATILHGNFEWDEAKARQNLKQHGVSFLEAISVFDDPLLVPYVDEEHSLHEKRYVILGLSNQNRALVVTYAERERTRIISARRLTPSERRSYEESEEKF